MEITLDANNFKSEVLSADIPVLVDFWAEWCVPCHVIAPSVAEIATLYQGRLKVGKLNVDENPQTAQEFGVRSIPNLKIFKNGQIVEEIVGAVPKQELTKRVQRHI